MSNRNATASWSGYLHQGQVGILLGLRKINKLIEESMDLNDWVIEYESAEDIDVKHGVKVVSRHQVKAYKGAKYPNDYKDVLGVLGYKMNKGNKVIASKGFQICEFDENAQPLAIEVEEDSRFLHTITETKGFDLSENEFTELYEQAIFIENPNNIKLYTYPDGRSYCELSSTNSKLNNFCKAEIKKVLTLDNHVFKDQEVQHKNILFAIISKLDMEIRRKHVLGREYFPELRLKEIYDMIIDTKEQRRTHIEFIREKFTESWVGFIEELETNEIYYDESQEEYIAKIVNGLYGLSDDDFVQFIKDINPDKNKVGNIETLDDVVDLCKPDSFKDIFFECLLNVLNEKFIIDYNGFKKDGGYLLTLINRKPSSVKSVMDSITKNPGTTSEIYERRYLINEQIDGVFFGGIMNNTTPEKILEDKWGGLASFEDRFFNPNMEFINLERAKKNLNRSGNHD